MKRFGLTWLVLLLLTALPLAQGPAVLGEWELTTPATLAADSAAVADRR